MTTQNVLDENELALPSEEKLQNALKLLNHVARYVCEGGRFPSHDVETDVRKAWEFLCSIPEQDETASRQIVCLTLVKFVIGNLADFVSTRSAFGVLCEFCTAVGMDDLVSPQQILQVAGHDAVRSYIAQYCPNRFSIFMQLSSM